jgi:hypothetical protein
MVALPYSNSLPVFGLRDITDNNALNKNQRVGCDTHSLFPLIRLTPENVLGILKMIDHYFGKKTLYIIVLRKITVEFVLFR